MLNSFRLTADILHLCAIIFLLLKILVTRSCSGVSGKSQVLYTLVFISRYAIDLVTIFISTYNTVFKILFITLTFINCYLIYIRYRKTYEKDYDTFRYEALLVICAILAIVFNYALNPDEVLWAFSIYLEAVTLLPQFFMMKTSPSRDRCVLLYLTMLFLYRLLYIFNWIYRYYTESHYDSISIIGGTIQVVLHWEFVYYYAKNIYSIINDLIAFTALVFALGSIKEAIVAYRASKMEPIENNEYVTKFTPVYTIKV